MSFPQTSHTLIQRIATGGDEKDWHTFLNDYWGPVCRFAMRNGHVSFEDAEDAASQTFQALLQNQLLTRWIASRSAKLRTLLCSVVRNVLANQARVKEGRVRLLRDHGGRLDDRDGLPLVPSLDAPAEQVDAFLAAWVETLLQRAVDLLMTQCHEHNRGDDFRVLHGKLCEGMTIPEIAAALGMSVTQTENAYKHIRKQLTNQLEDLVREHVQRYCIGDAADTEFVAEWGQLGEHLKQHGGLEDAVRRAYAQAMPQFRKSGPNSAMHLALERIKEARNGVKVEGT